MTFTEGHKQSVKLTTEELKREAYRQYCSHIARGRPKKAWRLKHPTITLTWETMEKYIKEDPTIFDPSEKKGAESDSLNRWFGILEDIATGDNQKGNVAACQIIMRNMHKWDSKDQSNEDNDGTALEANEKLMGQLSQLQKKD